MGRINSRSKGQRGERQAIDLLQPIIDEVYASTNAWLKRIGGMRSGMGGGNGGGMVKELVTPVLQRNTLQSDKGGFDIVGLDWLALEVKNVETSEPSMIDSWWRQAVDQAKKGSVNGRKKRAVLMYKRNRARWRVRMIGKLVVSNERAVSVSIPVDIDIESFLKFFRERMLEEVRQLVQSK